ncbi:MAG: hypothetical protein V1859_11720 [archaeon]
MKKLNFAVILFVLLVCANSALGLNFNAKFTAVNNQIYLDENAQFTLTLTNNANIEEIYQVYSTNVGWQVGTDPALIKLLPGETKNVSVELFPSNEWVTTGPQQVKITIESINTENKYEEGISVYVKWSITGRRQYAPSIELRTTFPQNVDPRQNIPLTIYLRNRNGLNIDKLIISVKSKLFTKEYSIPFSGLEERTESNTFSIDKLTLPQQDTLEIDLIIGNETVNKARLDYEIISYSDFVEETDTKKEFFKITKEITIKNIGNYENQENKVVSLELAENLFTKTSVVPNKSFESGAVEYTWEISLKPYEEKNIVIVTDYKPVLYVLVFVLICLLFYITYRSPVLSKKEVLIIGHAREGIGELKVIVYLKNRTSETISNLFIVDKVPNLVELMKGSYIGTVEPTKILTHDKKGTLVKWELKALEPFEERVITYRIRPKLGIFGGISLPAAKITFDTKGGKERTIRSNRCELTLKHH